MVRGFKSRRSRQVNVLNNYKISSLLIFIKIYVIIYIENQKGQKEMLPLTLHSLKKKVTSAVYERGCTGVTALAKKTKPPFAEERNINTESSSWQL